MQAIHKVNLIHQDLKPENILLTNSGNAKITDFGISETFRSSKSRIEESSVKGTYAYASPEQLIGKGIGKEADIWSFGTTMYHVLAGQTLYSGNNSEDVSYQIKNREFEALAEISDKMNALLTKCLQRDYQERYRDFGEVLEDINTDAFLSGKHVLDKTKKLSDDKRREAITPEVPTIGESHLHGKGVEKNDNEAIKWYRKSAEQGEAIAQNNLGAMYAYGEGVEQNYNEAVKWYRKSAEQGYARALTNLGFMYANGEGVEQDYKEAVKWYRKSAEQEIGRAHV